MGEPVFIYTSAKCGWAVRNYATLFEKGVAFEAVDVKESGAARADFAGKFPYALTPGLRHGDTLVWDSLLINDYIEEAFPEPALLPSEPVERARARQWLHHCDAVLFPALYAALRDREAPNTLQATLDHLSLDAFQLEPFAPFWGASRRLGLVDIAYHVLFKSLQTPGLHSIVQPEWMRAWAIAIANAPSIKRAEAFMDSLRNSGAA